MQVFDKGPLILIRFIAFSRAKITGCYRFDECLQFSPVGDNDPHLDVDYGNHPFVVEYEFKRPDISKLRATSELGLSDQSDRVPDLFLIQDYARQIQKEIAALLCLLVDPWLTVRYSVTYNWVLDPALPEQCRYAQSGYVVDLSKGGENLSTPASNYIEMEPNSDHFNSFGHLVGSEFHLPNSIDAFLQAYFSLAGQDRAAFQKALSLFHQSMQCKPISDSLAFLGLISTIEILIAREHSKANPEKCKDCGQPKFQVRQKFLSFLQKYASDTPKYRKVADEMYKTRSGIAHTGTLLTGDLIGAVTTPQERLVDAVGGIEAQVSTRIALVNWLGKRGTRAGSSLEV